MRQRPLRIDGRTYFQQKYAAKQETRRYHGEHLTKRQWQNIFKHSLHSVVPMSAVSLAAGGGSEQAMGRGSGLELLPPGRRERMPGSPAGIMGKVPYMNQMWAPMERRLDMAIFRAMFASSARQARQFVVHGFVNVNGKKMKHPGYMLNPGDMFSVDPDQVLFATGKPKDYEERMAKLEKMFAEQAAREMAAAEESGSDKDEAAEGGDTESKEETLDKPTEETPEGEKPKEETPEAGKLEEETSEGEKVKEEKSEEGKPKEETPERGRPKEETPEGEKSKEETPEGKVSVPEQTPTPEEGASEEETQTVKKPPPVEATIVEPVSNASPGGATPQAELVSAQPNRDGAGDKTATDPQEKEEVDPNNPLDPSKPYMTPWQPRDYLSPFAFIPRYLEVNFNTCHAVYLRHPVARPAQSEVPSPFGPDTQQLAFHWFLRRR